jgi:hypothetical protein
LASMSLLFGRRYNFNINSGRRKIELRTHGISVRYFQIS